MDYSRKKRELFLMQQICATLMSLARKLDTQNNKYAKDLTARQYMVILAIQLSPQSESTMMNIAKRLSTTKQNAAQLILTLERKGYVSRSTCDNNKREIKIKVTDSGINAMLEYAKTDVTVIASIFNGFTEEEMEMLWHLLQKLYRYDGIDYSGFEFDVHQFFESEYSGLLTKMEK